MPLKNPINITSVGIYQLKGIKDIDRTGELFLKSLDNEQERYYWLLYDQGCDLQRIEQELKMSSHDLNMLRASLFRKVKQCLEIEKSEGRTPGHGVFE